MAIGDHAGSFILGPGHDVAQAQAVAAVCGARAGATPSTAILAALSHLGISRVAVTSPYDAEMTAAGVAFLQSGDVEVATAMQASLADEGAISGVEAALWAAAARALDHADAEAILMMSGGLRLGGVIHRLEAELGKPVVTAPSALVWHACRLLGQADDRPALGLLFGADPHRRRTASHFGPESVQRHQNPFGQPGAADLCLRTRV